MGFSSVVKGIFKSVNAPFYILEDWATEPLKRWENKREQGNKDRDVQREIERTVGVEKVRTDLQIKMQTQIDRMRAETRQWEEDQDAARRIKLLDAFKKYQEELMALNTNAIRAIGEMNLELKEKAQALVLEKTKEYKALQDEAQKQAMEECDMIEEKYANNERVKSMLLNASETKLVGIMNNCTRFIDELSEDIKEMNKSINQLTASGQNHIQKVLEGTLNVKPSNLKLNDGTEDAKVIEE